MAAKRSDDSGQTQHVVNAGEGVPPAPDSSVPTTSHLGVKSELLPPDLLSVESAITDPETLAALREAGELVQAQPLPQAMVQYREGFGDLLDLNREDFEPGYEYRWVHKNAKKVATRKAQGYRVVNPQDEQIRNFSGELVHVEADNTYTVGDLVLMKCPKQIHSYRRAAKEQRAASSLDAAVQGEKRQFLRSAKRHGVEVITTREPGRE